MWTHVPFIICTYASQTNLLSNRKHFDMKQIYALLSTTNFYFLFIKVFLQRRIVECRRIIMAPRKKDNKENQSKGEGPKAAGVTTPAVGRSRRTEQTAGVANPPASRAVKPAVSGEPVASTSTGGPSTSRPTRIRDRGEILWLFVSKLLFTWVESDSTSGRT
jgi:hypothetical protein